MNYNNPNLLSALAGEYVLGTLRGQARARFEKLTRQSPELQAAVQQWENRLAGLNELIDEHRPPARTWKSIEKRLFSNREPEPLAVNPAATLFGFWRYLAIGASAVSLLLGLYIALPLMNLPQKQLGESYISIFENEQQQAIWAIRIDTTNDLIRVNSVNVPPLKPDQDYQLWLLQPNDEPPVSLGLLPQSGEFVLPRAKLPYGNANGIAVSLEPKGGSTTGLPTGPVLYVAKLLELG